MQPIWSFGMVGATVSANHADKSMVARLLSVRIRTDYWHTLTLTLTLILSLAVTANS